MPVVEATVARARRVYLRAARKHLWTELRLDFLTEPDLGRLLRTRPGPVIATNRLQSEGGRWSGSEAARRRLLEEALELGVDGLDLEWAAEAGWRREIWQRRGETKIILSWHDFAGTPEDARLGEILAQMLEAEADIVKLITYAREPGDNLRVLALIPKVRAQGREIIAFCMGPAGKWSRVAAPFLGSFLTFAPLSPKQASAPGQVSVNELRRIWRTLR